MKILNRIFREFRTDNRGSVLIESVIFLPAMIFTYIGFSIAWDGYRDNNLAQKATYAVADIISRERGVFNSNTMLNYVRIFSYAAEIPTAVTMANMTNGPVAVRITSVLFDEADTTSGTNSVILQFSFTSSGLQLPKHTAGSLQGIMNKIPALQDGDNIIIVESRLKWVPLFSAEDATDLINPNNNRASAADNATWFAARTIDTFTTVRPRFVPRLCWKDDLKASTCEL
jgi:Flp pilus assembly protein TadG